MIRKINKKGAMELSISTIIIIVLGVTMLILGMVLVRSIMCKALNLTIDIDSKAQSELNKVFGSTGGEIACIGESTDPVKVLPGQQNIIACAVRAPVQASYTFKLISAVSSSATSLPATTIQSWIRNPTTTTFNIAPGDEKVKKILYLNIPDTAPEVPFTINVEVSKNGQLINTVQLDFVPSRVGFVKSAMC